MDVSLRVSFQDASFIFFFFFGYLLGQGFLSHGSSSFNLFAVIKFVFDSFIYVYKA